MTEWQGIARKQGTAEGIERATQSRGQGQGKAGQKGGSFRQGGTIAGARNP